MVLDRQIRPKQRQSDGNAIVESISFRDITTKYVTIPQVLHNALETASRNSFPSTPKYNIHRDSIQ